jgi:FMN phosphatase YigB (HAD superfamily)
MDQLPAVLRTIAPHVSPATFVAYWFERDSRVVSAFFPAFAALRATGARIYLATNQEHLRAAHLMDTLGLAHHVDGIFYSARLQARKPDHDFFARVQAEVGLRGDEILLVDDSQENIEAALTAGWHALLWTRHSVPSVVGSAVPTRLPEPARPGVVDHAADRQLAEVRAREVEGVLELVKRIRVTQQDRARK